MTMLHIPDFVDYLKQQGFDVQSASVSESLTGKLQDIAANNKTQSLINLPFVKGLKDVKISKCVLCDEKFANIEILDNHYKTVHNSVCQEDLNDNSEKNQNSVSGNEISTQYDIFNGDFIAQTDNVQNDEESFYLVLKINNCFDMLNTKSGHGGERRIRRVETKPRKNYKRPGKPEAKNEVDLLAGPFNCVRCDGVFHTCCNYSKHFHQEHSKRKSTAYKCQICEKKFNLNVMSVQSMECNQESTGEAPIEIVTCSECGLTFQSGTDLILHQQIDHTKEKTLKCDYMDCSKTFTTYAALNQHTKLHSGIKPFICSFESCMKSFSQKSGLEQHIRTHTLQRPYTCVICNTSFKQSAHLGQHMRTHSKIQPYSCPHCPKRFKQSSHLSHHIQVIHNVA